MTSRARGLSKCHWNKRDSAAALLAWELRKGKAVGEYRLGFSTPPAVAGAVTLSLAMANDDPTAAADVDADADADATGKHVGKAKPEDWKTPDSLDFSLVLTDTRGHSASVPLSAVARLLAPVAVTTRKVAMLDPLPTSEPVFKRVAFPLARFAGIDPAALSALSLRFDRSPAGAIYVDDITLLPGVPVPRPGSTALRD